MEFQVDSNEKYKQLETEVIKNLKNKDDEHMVPKKKEPTPIVHRELKIQQHIQKIIGILKKLPDKKTLMKKLKEIISNDYSSKKDPTNKSNPRPKAPEDFKASLDLGINETEEPNPKQSDESEESEESEEEPEEKEEDKILKNTMEEIKNIFTLILLFYDPDKADITLQDAINIDDIKDDINIDRINTIIKICKGGDSQIEEEIPNMMYYCYLIQNYIKNIEPGDIVVRKNKNKENVKQKDKDKDEDEDLSDIDEDDDLSDIDEDEENTTTQVKGIILRIVTKYICRDTNDCLKNGQRIRFIHAPELIATYNKSNDTLLYKDTEYETLNKLLSDIYKEKPYKGWNAWEHFEREKSPEVWEPMLNVERKAPHIKDITGDEYKPFLEKINTNQNRCTPTSKKTRTIKPAKKTKDTKARSLKKQKKDDKTKKSKPTKDIKPKKEPKTRSSKPKKDDTPKVSWGQAIKKVENPPPREKHISIDDFFTLGKKQKKQKVTTSGGKSGLKKKKQTTYYILWNYDKEEPERCIEEYDESQFNKSVDIIYEIDPQEIQKIIRKYLGDEGLISILLEKAEPEINKLFGNIKEEMKKLDEKIQKEKDSFEDETHRDGNICSDFFKSSSPENEKVLEIIRKHLSPKDTERKLFGEVFTPLEIVCEMLSKLPSNVWTNKDLKWLDPANGIGNFPVVVYYKLMKTLKSVPERERSRHIIEKMLYMNELTTLNVEICRRIFKMIDPQAKPNLLKANFLTEFMVGEKPNKKCWFYDEDKPIQHFDIILGNPPYNPPKTATGSSGNNIWPHFVMKSFYLLDDTRPFKPLLLFIHPPGWKKPAPSLFKKDKFKSFNFSGQIWSGHVWQQLKEKGVFSFIYTNDQLTKSSSEFIKHFPAVDFYVYQKGSRHSVSCDTKNIFLGQPLQSVDVKLNYTLNYLPNLITKETQDILHEVTTKPGSKSNFHRNRQLKYNQNMFSKDSEKYSKDMVHKYFYETKTGGIPVYAFSEKELDNIKQNKLVFNSFGGINGYYVEYIPKKDKIGSADHSMYTLVDSDEEGEHLKIFFNSDIVKFIFLITQYSSGMRTMNESLVANSITVPPIGVKDYYRFFGIEKHKSYIEDILTHYESFKQPKKPATEKPKPKKETKRAKFKKGGKRYTRKI
jgi:hypothetical protein